MSARVLLVDDDPALLRLLGLRLESVGYEVISAAGGEQCLAIVAQSTPDVVITDLRMDGLDGLQVQERLAARWPSLPVIIITAHGTIPDAVTATQSGAFGFLTKPIDTPKLLELVDNAVGLVSSAPADGSWRSAVLGHSVAMKRLLDRARRVARSSASVLVTGASGTGKDALARAIHAASARRGEFVAVNCAAIPASLLESELFGHDKGAFTGATEARQGLIRRADGGTLLLDEIGDMPIELQAKLLRVLEEREIRAVGAQASQAVDLRVIAATHRDLDSARAAGEFRDDLYYRLRVVHLEMPSLSERRADIVLLCEHKLTLIAVERNADKSRFSPAAMQLLIAADYPGNVRQLFNVVEHCVALSPTRVISARMVADALGEWADEEQQPRVRELAIEPLDQARDSFMHDYLLEIMQLTNGNVSNAARLARRNRTDFYKLLNRHHVDWSRFKAS